MFCHMLEQANKIGGRMVRRERTGWYMLRLCHQGVIHLAHTALQQGIFVLIMLVERRAMHHGPLTNVFDRYPLERALGKLCHERLPQQFVGAPHAKISLLLKSLHRHSRRWCCLSYSAAVFAS